MDRGVSWVAGGTSHTSDLVGTASFLGPSFLILIRVSVSLVEDVNPIEFKIKYLLFKQRCDDF